MNKNEAIAYGQIAFETMMNSKYKGELSITNFGLEMKQALKIYPRNIVQDIAKNKIYAEEQLKKLKNGCGSKDE